MCNPDRSTDIEAVGFRLSGPSRFPSSGKIEGSRVSENDEEAEEKRSEARPQRGPIPSRKSLLERRGKARESVLRNMERERQEFELAAAESEKPG